MGDPTGQKDDSIHHHQGADDAADQADQETGPKGVAEKFELQGFPHHTVLFRRIEMYST